MKLKEQAAEKIKTILGVSSCSFMSLLPSWHVLNLVPEPSDAQIEQYAKLLEATGIKASHRLASKGLVAISGTIEVHCTFEAIINSKNTEAKSEQQQSGGYYASARSNAHTSFLTTPAYKNSSYDGFMAQSSQEESLSIHEAVKRNRLPDVKRLLQANPKLIDDEKYDTSGLGFVTPLEIAAIYGHVAIIKYLASLRAGVSKKVANYAKLSDDVKEALKEIRYRKVGQPPSNPRCPHRSPSPSVVEEIKQVSTSHNLKIISQWIDHDPYCIATNPNDYDSPLRVAIRSGIPDVLRLLLDNDVVLPREAICWAADISSHTNCVQQMQVLIEYGAGQDSLANSLALFEALGKDNCQQDVIKLLLTLPINWQIQDRNQGRLLLHYAFQRMPSVIPFMVNAGADINQVDSKGYALLHKIADGQLNPVRELEILHVILQLKPDPSLRLPSSNMTAYQHAYFANKHTIAQVIAEYTTLYSEEIAPSDTLWEQKQQIAKYEQLLRSQRAGQALVNAQPLTETSSNVDQLYDLAIGLQYRIPAEDLSTIKILGEGGFGVVTLSKWHHTEVAIKTVKAIYSNEALSIFKEEADILFKLRHPNIISMFGISVDTNKYSIVMEYMPTGSLNNVLQADEPLNWTYKVKIIHDIANGLFYLHQADIMHRDLKSHNVLINGMVAKISDFGLAKTKQESVRSSRKSVNEAVGTIPWMAPELFRRRPYTTKSDIYSLGMVFWEIATRQEPWREEDVGVIVGMVVTGERENIPDDIPLSLANLIRFCWEHDVDKRYDAQKVVEYINNSNCDLKIN